MKTTLKKAFCNLYFVIIRFLQNETNKKYVYTQVGALFLNLLWLLITGGKFFIFCAIPHLFAILIAALADSYEKEN